jgi:hypothetical protein
MCGPMVRLALAFQYDLVGIAAPGGGGSVPGRGTLTGQPVTKFFADGTGLWDHRDQNAAGKSRGPAPQNRVCNSCKAALWAGRVTERASQCTCGSCC